MFTTPVTGPSYQHCQLQINGYEHWLVQAANNTNSCQGLCSQHQSKLPTLSTASQRLCLQQHWLVQAANNIVSCQRLCSLHHGLVQVINIANSSSTVYNNTVWSKLPTLSTAVGGYVRLFTTPLTGPSIQSTLNSHVHSTTDGSKLKTMSTECQRSCSQQHWLVQATNIVSSSQ